MNEIEARMWFMVAGMIIGASACILGFTRGEKLRRKAMIADFTRLIDDALKDAIEKVREERNKP